jgi:hypothetical protein
LGEREVVEGDSGRCYCFAKVGVLEQRLGLAKLVDLRSEVEAASSVVVEVRLEEALA